MPIVLTGGKSQHPFLETKDVGNILVFLLLRLFVCLQVGCRKAIYYGNMDSSSRASLMLTWFSLMLSAIFTMCILISNLNSK